MDTLHEHRVDLVASAEGPPDMIYPPGREVEEFQRTVSRLVEMQSQDDITTPHAV